MKKLIILVVLTLGSFSVLAQDATSHEIAGLGEKMKGEHCAKISQNNDAKARQALVELEEVDSSSNK